MKPNSTDARMSDADVPLLLLLHAHSTPLDPSVAGAKRTLPHVAAHNALPRAHSYNRQTHVQVKRCQRQQQVRR